MREATSFGAALCALVGAGVFTELCEAVAATSKESGWFEPDPATHAVYDEAYERWQVLYPHLLAAAEQGMASFLWRGAGA